MTNDSAVGAGLSFALVFFAIVVIAVFLRFVPIGLWMRAMASGGEGAFHTPPNSFVPARPLWEGHGLPGPRAGSRRCG